MDSLSRPLPLERLLLARTRSWISVCIWVAGFLCMVWMQSSLRLGLAAVTVTLILTSALASLFVRPLVAVVGSLGAALLFYLLFVPVNVRDGEGLRENHELILFVALSVSLLVGVLTSRLRIVGVELKQRMEHLRTLNRVSTTLNQSVEPAEEAEAVRGALASIVGGEVGLVVDARDLDALPPGAEPPALLRYGRVTDHELAGLQESMRSQALVNIQPLSVSLPLRGQKSTLGAALLTWPSQQAMAGADLDAAQTVCNLTGMALERAQRTRKAAAASESAYRRQLSNLVLSAISHEYRTPLATILSQASSLRQQGERMNDRERANMLEGIVEEVVHLRRVTGNMLQLARLDARSDAVRVDWESVEDLIGSVLHRFHGRYPGWRVTVELAPDLPLIRCDAVLLTQVLENLLDNAHRYAGPQAPSISAWTSGPSLHIAVKDRGPGIEPTLVPRLFKAFERGQHKADSSWPLAERHRRKGSGVGLALCRAILRAHGGDIVWSAREGGGCVFVCQVPLAADLRLGLPASQPESDPSHEAEHSADRR